MRRSLAALALALVLPLPALAGEVTVQPGETLSEIADRLGVSVQRLMDLNDIRKADHVEAGQVLRVPGATRASSRRTGSTASGRITVQEGDTLSEIADRQGMSLSQLMALNGLTKADHVEVGQVLKVKGSTAATSAAASPAPAFRKGASVHVVRSGESLSEIAEGYGVSMQRLVAINAIDDPNHVEVGTRLKLKGEAPAPRPVASAPRPAALAPRPAIVTPRPRPAVESVTEATAAATVPAAATVSTPAVTQATAAASGLASSVGAGINPVDRSAPTPAAAPAPRPATVITPRPAAVASTPRPAAVVASRPAVTPTTGTTTANAAAAPTLASSSWRPYGPLQVDWSNWQPMGGSLVAPVMNAKGETLYLAINCGARKMNATSAAGDWRTWDDPQADFERRLVNDLCTSRG